MQVFRTGLGRFVAQAFSSLSGVRKAIEYPTLTSYAPDVRARFARHVAGGAAWNDSAIDEVGGGVSCRAFLADRIIPEDQKPAAL
jgi:hypothetical protein